MATIIGTPGDDLNLDGTSGNDTIIGDAGNDVLGGIGGADTLHRDDNFTPSVAFNSNAVPPLVIGKSVSPVGDHIGLGKVLGSRAGSVPAPTSVVDSADDTVGENSGVAASTAQDITALEQRGETFSMALNDRARGPLDGTFDVTIAETNSAPVLLSPSSASDSFLGDGKALTNFFNNSDDYGRSIALQNDGKIVVSGYTYSSASADFALARYNADGSLDTSFGGGDGTVTTGFSSNSFDVGYSVALQADGRIVVAGSSIEGFALARYNSDGSPDITFGGGADGKVTLEGSEAHSVAVQADGRILVLGYAQSDLTSASVDLALVRLNTDGSLDSGFGGGDGRVTTAFFNSTDFGSSVAVQADGKIVVSGYSFNGANFDFTLARFDTDGTLDGSFGGGDGKVTTAFFTNTGDICQSVAMQSDGNIVVAGYSFDGTNEVFALARYDSDGNLDTSFGGGDGKVTTDFFIGNSDFGDYGASVALQVDGKIVVAGHSRNTKTELAIARYNTDGSLDTSFGGDGKVTSDFNIDDSPSGVSVVIQADGKIVVSDTAYNGTSYDFLLARYNADGTLDTNFTAATLVEDSTVPTLSAVGGFGFDDPDQTDMHNVSVTTGLGNTLGGNLTTEIGTAATGAASGTIAWTYTLANSATQQLAQGQQVDESFILTVDDGHGGTASQTVDVAVIGVNDAPTLAGALSDQNALQGQTFSFTLPPGTFADVDATDTLVYTAARADGSSLPTWLAFDPQTRSFSGTPLVGDAGVFDVRVRATDNHGAPVDDVFEVMVGGVNALPVVATSDLDGAVTELVAPRFSLVDSGTIAFSDADFTDAHVVVEPIEASAGAIGNLSASVTAPISAVDGTGGEITWDYGVAADEVEYLAAGEHKSESFTITLDDGHGGTVDRIVGVTITGTNDAPVKTEFLTNGHDYGNSVAVQADGKIVVAGYAIDAVVGSDFQLVRYNSDGSLDTSFGGDGKVTTGFSNSSNDEGYSVALQADGKIVVSGTSSVGEDDNFALARFNADGSLDTTFGGGDGKVTTDFSTNSNDQGYSVALQADGKIVVTGTSYVNGNSNFTNVDFALARYNSDGSLDAGFGGGDGKVTTDFSTNVNDLADYGYSVALQADGKIVVAGGSYDGLRTDFAVARYNSDGSLDNSFGGDGKVTTDLFTNSSDFGRSVALQVDGKIVVAGFVAKGNDNDFALARYDIDGSLDTTFGGDGEGKVTTDFFTNSHDAGLSVALQADGKIVVAGGTTSSNGANDDFALARYNTDGSLDTTFGGGDGKVTTDFFANESFGLSAALQADGKIVVSGFSKVGRTSDLALARYNTDGSLDTSFKGAWLVEDSGTSNLVGSFGFDDVDLTDTHTASVVALAGNTLGGNLAAVIGTAATGAAVGSVDWNYTVANSATQQLAQGQQVSESFTVTINDGHGGTVRETINVSIVGVNDAPTLISAIADQTAAQGQTFNFTLPAGTFADEDIADVLVYTAARVDGSPLPAWLIFDAITQTFSGTPANGDVGVVDVRVTATDPSNVSASDVVRFTVANTNAAPTAAGDAAVTLRNIAVTVPVRGNDTDPDGDALTVTGVSQGTNGTVVIDGATGNPRYTPNANFAGLDSFTYTVSDGRGGTATASVNVTVATRTGTEGPDTIVGTAGADVIASLGSADSVTAGGGNDYVDAGAGNDVIIGGAGADTLKGGDGDDTFRVTGNELTGDVIDGGEGSDTLQFTGNVSLGGAFTLTSVETLNMGGFALAVQTTAAVNLSELDLLNAGAINGDGTANTITGTKGADAISGGAGNDVLAGFTGNDTLNGGAGADTVDGGDGDDLIIGGAGADTLQGGAGNDTFRVTGAEWTGDVIDGGAGDDTLQFTGNVALAGGVSILNVENLNMAGFALSVQTTAAVDLSSLSLLNGGAINGDAAANNVTGTKGADTISGGAGTDTLNGGEGNDIIAGGAGADSLQGGSGDDTFRVTGAELTGDTVDGGAGNDTLQFTGNVALGGALSLVSVETLDMGGFALNVQTTTAVNLSGLLLLNGGAINGDATANNITGTAANDTVNGGAGNDVLAGYSGDDTLSGSTGNDSIDGGDGNDIIVGGVGADTLQGGAGADTFRISGTDFTGDVIDGGAGSDTLQFTGNVTLGSAFTAVNLEQLDMGGFGLTVQTTALVDLSALSLLNGGNITGDGGTNSITGTSGADNINGGGGSDYLRGGLGNDVLFGGAGADVIIGGTGNDLLFGGSSNAGDGAADTFVFNSPLDAATNVDTITGFEATLRDRIALDPTLFAAVVLNGTTALDTGEFRASAGGNAADANDFILYDSSTGSLYYDPDGNGAAAKLLFAALTGVTGVVDALDFTTDPPPGA